MKATFGDFIKQNPNCKKFEDDGDMQRVFDFLSQDFIIVQMIDASEAKRPALAPVAANVEHFFIDSNFSHCSSLDDNFTKQAVGLMIKTILEPFGFVVWKQKDLPKNSRAEKFQSASVYQRSLAAKPRFTVRKSIEAIHYGDHNLCNRNSDYIETFCDEKEAISDGEFGELLLASIRSPYTNIEEHTKHFYGRYGHKVSLAAKHKLAKVRLFSWYMRSFITSDFSAKHPSYGVYGASLLGREDLFDDDIEIRTRLKAEFGERPAEADKHMPLGESYWQCD